MSILLPNAYRSVFFMFLLVCVPSCMYSDNDSRIKTNESIDRSIANESDGFDKLSMKCGSHRKGQKKYKNLTYYLYVSDFINSFIEIPTSNVSGDSSTLSSTYLAGRAPIYNSQNVKFGTCSASFLCMQDGTGIFTDISNYLAVDNGLIVTWFTPTTLINLELDSIVHSMVTECIVVASTKVGFNPFYGKTFNMVVSSDNEKIYFKLSKI